MSCTVTAEVHWFCCLNFFHFHTGSKTGLSNWSLGSAPLLVQALKFWSSYEGVDEGRAVDTPKSSHNFKREPSLTPDTSLESLVVFVVEVKLLSPNFAQQGNQSDTCVCNGRFRPQ